MTDNVIQFPIQANVVETIEGFDVTWCWFGWQISFQIVKLP